MLFLDYDGVLHPGDVYLLKGGPVLMRDGIALFEWAPLLEEALMPYADVKIVLSTSWVPVLRFDVAKSRLPQGLQNRVIGATYHSRFAEQGISREVWMSFSRYQQIQRYVTRHIGMGPWLAIDDDMEGWPNSQRHRVVTTDEDLGIAENGKIDELITKLETCR